MKTTNDRYHKQFFHGISSAHGVPFAAPTSIRTIWQAAPAPTGLTVFLMTEGLCPICTVHIPLYKNRKRFTHFFPSAEAFATLGEAVDDSGMKRELKRGERGTIEIPGAMSVPQSLMDDVRAHEEGKMSGVW